MKESISTGLYRHVVDIQVRFNDIDMQGHASNTVYQNYYDNGKLDYFDKVIGEIDWDREALVGASVTINYIKPIYLKTKIAVKTRVARIGNKSITFEHCIVNRENDEVLSDCKAVLVYYDPETKKSLPVPDSWRHKIMVFEGDELSSVRYSGKYLS